MRPRHQEGQICKSGASWVFRFYEDRFDKASGRFKRVRTKKPLAPIGDYKTAREARNGCADEIRKILVSVNSADVGVSLTLAEFIEMRYFPRLDVRVSIPPGTELHIEPSTVKGYRDIFKCHIEDHPVADVQIRDFTTRHGQSFLESLPQHLSHQTHLRIKNFLRGVFTWAIADGAYKASNPMEATKAGGRTKQDNVMEGLTDSQRLRKRKIQASNNHAYTLEEVAEMLDKLPDPARTVCAVAAFTGLSRSELKGLKWEDYDGQTIKVQRKVWGDHVGAPKTEAREAGVYVVPLLRGILAKYKIAFPPLGDKWMFRGEKMLRPLDLDNLSRRDIPRFINGAWFGWHAFRRGLGTRLSEAGVDDKDIQLILRHADVSTTLAYYIQPNLERAKVGLKKLDKILRTKYGIKV